MFILPNRIKTLRVCPPVYIFLLNYLISLCSHLQENNIQNVLILSLFIQQRHIVQLFTELYPPASTCPCHKKLFKELVEIRKKCMLFLPDTAALLQLSQILENVAELKYKTQAMDMSGNVSGEKTGHFFLILQINNWWQDQQTSDRHVFFHRVVSSSLGTKRLFPYCSAPAESGGNLPH